MAAPSTEIAPRTTAEAVVSGRVSNQPHNKRFMMTAFEWLIIGLFFTAASLCYLNPLWHHAGSYIVGPGDPLQHLSVQWWTSVKLLSGDWQGMWDIPPMYYPAHSTLAYGDPQFGTTIVGLPIFLLTKNIVAAYNFPILIAFPLSGIGAYALLKYLTANRYVSLLGAFIWAFCPWHAGEAAHQQILSIEFLPWILLSLHRYADTRKRSWLVLFSLFWTAQAFMAEYWGAFLILLIPPFSLLLMKVRQFTRKDMKPLFVAIFIGILPWLIMQYPMLHSGHKSGHTRTEIIEHSADITDYLPRWVNSHFTHGYLPPRENNLSPGLFVLLGAAFSLYLSYGIQLRPMKRAEMSKLWIFARRAGIFGLVVIPLLYLGFLFIGMPEWIQFRMQIDLNNFGFMSNAYLYAVALCYNQPIRTQLSKIHMQLKKSNAVELPYLALFCLSALFSFGYSIDWHGRMLTPGLYNYFDWLPGLKSLRVLHRVGVFADLALVVMAGMGLADLLRKYRDAHSPKINALHTAMLILCVLVCFDISIASETPFTRSGNYLPHDRKADRWLSMQPTGSVIELPLTVDPITEGERLWHQIKHKMPMVNGAETYFRKNYYSDVNIFTHPQSPKAIERLRKLGISYIILDLHNRYTGEKTYLGNIPKMPASLLSPYKLNYQDNEVKIYSLDIISAGS